MKKLVIVLLLGLFAMMPIVVSAQDTIIGEHIVRFDEQNTINRDGSVLIRETIIYDFGSEYKHGIYRYIPYLKTNEAGKQYKLDYGDIHVVNESGRAYHFTKTRSNGNVNLKIGDSDRTITGVHTYVISYTVKGALTYFKDHDELYWNVTGNGWDVPIGEVSASVSVPGDATSIQTMCYTGAAGSTASDCVSKVVGTSAVFVSRGSVGSNQGMTIVVGFPKGRVAVLEPEPVIPFFDTLLGRITLVGLIIAGIAWYIVYPLYLPYKWWKEGRDPKTRGPVTAAYDAPKTHGGRSLTPAESGTLLDEKADTRDILASLIDLARRGYIRIEERKKGDFYLVDTSDNMSKRSSTSNKNTKNIEQGLLQPYESQLFNAIFDHKSEVHVKDLHIYEDIEKVKKTVYASLVSEDFFAGNPESIRTVYQVITFLAFITGNLLLIFSALIFGMNMPRKTVFGKEQADVAESLRRFLNSQERQLAFQADKQLFFEKLLPYAVAFGVERVWFKRFGDITLKPPEWYHGYYGSQFSNDAFARSLSSSMNSFGSSVKPVSSSSGYSSGFSGGSSGGGGGGGGGGSW